MDLTIQIGGYTMHVHEPDNHPCLTWPLRPFDDFLASPIFFPNIRVNVTILIAPVFTLLAEGTIS